MIRININSITKREIEKIYLNDAYTAKTGIFKILEEGEIKDFLRKKHSKIYAELYCRNSTLNQENVKRLLLADRTKMKEYITKFDTYEKKPTEADELLEKIFRYDRYSQRKVVTDILRKMDIDVCPYCNRQYIYIVESGKVRPQLDHYYPKDRYPYLALCLYNMVPCCGICNMTKSDLDTFSKPVLYPYEEEFGYNASFTLKIRNNVNYVKVLQGVSSEFTISINQKNEKDEIKNQIEKMHLKELYDQHVNYVMDIIKSRYINTLERLEEIYEKFPQIFDSYQEVKKIAYFVDTRKEEWGRRPLSKLTYDIDCQLEQGEINIGE